MTILIVVQARTGSSRFPGKVLAPVAGQPMLGFMLDRIASLADEPGTTLLVATSLNASDDEVAAVATTKGCAVVRGSETDVLGRFRAALDKHPADHVVRLTADCPLMDPDVVRSVVASHLTNGADYTSNTLARTFPDGLDVEVMEAGALLWADAHARLAVEREHVTPHLLRHPRRFQLAQHMSDLQAGEERWTVDVPEDLRAIQAAIASADHPASAGWRQILERIGPRATAGDVTASPVPTPPHRRGSPYHRQWVIDDPLDARGVARVIVDDGGIGTLELEASRPDVAEAAVRERLRSDLQITQLTTPLGGVT